jgi:hypothetical protein
MRQCSVRPGRQQQLTHGSCQPACLCLQRGTQAPLQTEAGTPPSSCPLCVVDASVQPS